MDMWNWLQENYIDGCLTIDFMEKVLSDSHLAWELYKEYLECIPKEEWIEECQDQVSSFYKYIMAKERYKEGNNE